MNVSKARELAGNVGFISCQNINEKVFCNESPKGNILVILFFEEFFSGKAMLLLIHTLLKFDLDIKNLRIIYACNHT